MSAVEFIIDRPNDEVMEVSVRRADGSTVEIAYANHDLHGWDGMGLLEDTISALADALDIRIVQA